MKFDKSVLNFYKLRMAKRLD